MRKSIWTGIIAFITMLILILESKTALAGARMGLDLCLNSVIPALFPFLILSVSLTHAFYGVPLPILRPLGKLFRIPQGTECILICAFLGGYPVGAQSIGSAYSSGYLERNQAQRMLAFCNNAGPAFLFGMAGPMFPSAWMIWTLWAIHIISAFLVSVILAPGEIKKAHIPQNAISLSHAMILSIKAMTQVCGWVILFRVFLAFLSRWALWIFPVWVQVAVTGLLELSNGILALHYIDDIALRFIICSCILSCGGLCVIMQTKSVINTLSLNTYLLGKGLQTFFSLILSVSLIYKQYWIIPGILLLIIPFKIRKNSGNPAAIGV